MANALGFGEPVLRSKIPGARLKGTITMRISMLALAAILTSAALPTSAQTVIDVEGQKAAAPPPQVQDQPRPQDQAPAPQSPAQTREGPRPSIQSRYSFNRVENGFLRVDNETGQIAYCRARDAGWACEAVPEDHSASETQIARLHDEVASLKKLVTEIARLQDDVSSLKKLEIGIAGLHDEVTSLKKLEPAITRLQDEVTPLKKLEVEIARLHDEITPLKKLEIGIAGLKDEIASLKKEVAALKEPPPPPRPPADLSPPPADKGGDVTIKLPTQEDIARARAFVEETWRRLVDMLVGVQKDIMRKG